MALLEGKGIGRGKVLAFWLGAFAEGLSWYADRSGSSDNQSPKRMPGFPSWSWCSIDGPVYVFRPSDIEYPSGENPFCAFGGDSGDWKSSLLKGSRDWELKATCRFASCYRKSDLFVQSSSDPKTKRRLRRGAEYDFFAEIGESPAFGLHAGTVIFDTDHQPYEFCALWFAPGRALAVELTRRKMNEFRRICVLVLTSRATVDAPEGQCFIRWRGRERETFNTLDQSVESFIFHEEKELEATIV